MFITVTHIRLVMSAGWPPEPFRSHSIRIRSHPSRVLCLSLSLSSTSFSSPPAPASVYTFAHFRVLVGVLLSICFLPVLLFHLLLRLFHLNFTFHLPFFILPCPRRLPVCRRPRPSAFTSLAIRTLPPSLFLSILSQSSIACVAAISADTFNSSSSSLTIFPAVEARHRINIFHFIICTHEGIADNAVDDTTATVADTNTHTNTHILFLSCCCRIRVTHTLRFFFIHSACSTAHPFSPRFRPTRKFAVYFLWQPYR